MANILNGLAEHDLLPVDFSLLSSHVYALTRSNVFHRHACAYGEHTIKVYAESMHALHAAR